MAHDFSETRGEMYAKERVGIAVSVREMQLELRQLAGQRPDKSNLLSTVQALRDLRLKCLVPFYVVNEPANLAPKHARRISIKPQVLIDVVSIFFARKFNHTRMASSGASAAVTKPESDWPANPPDHRFLVRVLWVRRIMPAKAQRPMGLRS
jgi:hypothetical protein